MRKQELLLQLNAYVPFDEAEAAHAQNMKAFLETARQPFGREDVDGGHVTASCLVVSPDFSHLLLNKHGISGVYLNFGGHCDGEEGVFETASKELEEEAGLSEMTILSDIFNLDIRPVAAHVRQGKEVPIHLHYDVLYLAVAPQSASFTVSEESTDIRWFSLDEAAQLFQSFPVEESGLSENMIRLLIKVRLLWQHAEKAA